MKKFLSPILLIIVIMASSFTSSDRPMPFKPIGEKVILENSIGSIPIGTEVTVVPEYVAIQELIVGMRTFTWPDCGYNGKICYCCYGAGGSWICKEGTGCK